MHAFTFGMDSPPPSSTATDWLKTSTTLLVGIRDSADQRSWAEFYRLYWRFVRGVARRAGLSDADADDAAQEVFGELKDRIVEFERRKERGTFRGWLAQLTRWRAADLLRKKRRRENREVPRPHPTDDEPTGPDPIESIPDPSAEEQEKTEREWQELLLDTALQRLALRVPAKHFQAFDLYNRRGWGVLRVAAELGMNPATVYVVSHRLIKLLRAEVELLKSQLH